MSVIESGLMQLIVPLINRCVGEYILENVNKGWRSYHSRNRSRIRGVKNLHPMPFYKKTIYERWGFE